ncbi:SufD family Fe-S cluster assembly protein [uncultured Sphaerochaeta sp.]|uniref:SufB/SufD family protein n=1 Tax=uncultured Sphaerochaeta sp. TaxID=886478 RepID=UPI002A0A9347|nr:SufD family Fe-S cluster assembly protein [uncultured Sphaerochaeta sp.]
MKQNVQQLHLENVNKIPVVTWRHLKMNGADLQIPYPDIPPLEERPVPPLGPGYAVGPFALSTQERKKVLAIPSGGGPEVDAFVSASDNAGFLLRLDRYSLVEKPIEIAYDLHENPSLVDDTAILVGEGAQATVVQSYRSTADGVSRFHAGGTHVEVGLNGHLTLVQVQMLDGSSIDFENTGFHLAQGATVSLVHVLLGGGKTFGNTKVVLEGDDSSFNLGCMYLADGTRLMDMNYVIEHRGKRTVSNITARGALFDSASKVFRGTVDFKVGSSQSKGAQQEYSLMFSPTVHNRSVPLILCGEEDVEGAHAVSTGRIDENALFYLMSRGLDEALAKKNLVKAQFAPIAAMITDEVLQNAVLAEVEQRMNRHE